MSRSRDTWALIWKWLTRRTPGVVFLRLFDQIMRMITGAPIAQYSKVTPQLYVGGQHRIHGLPLMKLYGITSIVNLRREYDDQKSGIGLDHYLYLPTTDNYAPSLDDLKRGVVFITSEIAQERTVYIHCGVGVGRAPTMAAAYLVSTGLTPAEAWRTIREVRPFIWPLPGQLAQINRYAEQIELVTD
ncbi:MAG: dual specificity protein phosphatase family protein [Chitinophagaceae bacterium]|nr:dual specificity protein phosphatase family protein [Anaerolineae bacterium]